MGWSVLTESVARLSVDSPPTHTQHPLNLLAFEVTEVPIDQSRKRLKKISLNVLRWLSGWGSTGSHEIVYVKLGVARGLLQERPLQFQHGNVRVKSWQPMSNSWSTSCQPDLYTLLLGRKTARNRQGKFLYTELLKSWSTLGQFPTNSPSHGKLQGSCLQ